MMHTMSPVYKSGNETLCGIEFHPLRFISYIVFHKLRTVEDPCDKCLEELNKLEENAKR